MFFFFFNLPLPFFLVEYCWQPFLKLDYHMTCNIIYLILFLHYYFLGVIIIFFFTLVTQIEFHYFFFFEFRELAEKKNERIICLLC
jgi:hypothetical protein